jgi:hypothetical protein
MSKWINGKAILVHRIQGEKIYHHHHHHHHHEL